jgi:transposase InsO family protein
MSDNASEFRSTTFQQTTAALGARQSFIRAGPDQQLWRTGPADHPGGVREAGLRPVPDPKQTGLRLDLERYLRDYNTERAHIGRWIRGRTAADVLGKAKLWHHNH